MSGWPINGGKLNPPPPEVPSAGGGLSTSERADLARAREAQPSISGTIDYAREVVPNGPLGVPVKDSELLQMKRGLKLHRDPYGMRDNAAILSVIASEAADPAVEILGLNSLDEASSYTARDNAALYVGIVARASRLSTAAGTTYTANSVTAPGVDFSKLRRGMWLDTRHRLKQEAGGAWIPAGSWEGRPAKWGGLVTGWSEAEQKIYVQRWDRPGVLAVPSTAQKAGTPNDGVAVSVSAQTAIWGANFTAGVYPNSDAHIAYGLEITTVNDKKAFNPALHEMDPDNVKVVGVGSFHSGLNAYAHFAAGGNSYYGMTLTGASYAAIAIGHQYASDFHGRLDRSPQYSILDTSFSEIGLAFINPKQDATIFAQVATGKGPALLSRGNGVHIIGQRENQTEAFRLSSTADVTTMDFGNGVQINANRLEPNVARVQAGNVLFAGLIRVGQGVQVGDKQVVGPQQAHIPDVTNATGDANRAIGQILAAMRAHGMIASAPATP